MTKTLVQIPDSPGVPMSDAEKDFLSLQWGCYVTVILEFASALFFLMGALTVTKDWTKAQKEEEGKVFDFLLTKEQYFSGVLSIQIWPV